MRSDSAYKIKKASLALLIINIVILIVMGVIYVSCFIWDVPVFFAIVAFLLLLAGAIVQYEINANIAENLDFYYKYTHNDAYKAYEGRDQRKGLMENQGDSWTCECGCVNSSYVTTCVNCFKKKPEK